MSRLRGLSVLSLFIAAIVLLMAAFAVQPPAPVRAFDSTLSPTETAIPLVTPTLVPASTPAALPTVNWSDVSLYKKAMRSGSEADIDRFVNANRYEIVATLSIEQDAIIRGAERVRYTNRTPHTLNEIVYRLYPNTPVLAGRMNVTHISVNGTDVAPTFEALDSVMDVPLQSPLAPNDSVEMLVDFNVAMTRGFDASYGRFGFVHNVVSGTAWYPTLSVYDEGLGWWKSMPSPQGDPAYTETGLYDVRLTTPGDMTVVMSGIEVEATKNADGTITHRGVTGPMRDHAFMASTRYVIDTTEVDGVTIKAVHYKDPVDPTIEGTQDVLKYSLLSVQTYDKTFGQYPFKELNVVENPTPTGVEFPGLVQIAESTWIQGRSYLEVVICHEIGHQWFYSLVGNNQVEHPWLDESLTSYTEFVYMRAAYPTGTRADDYVAGKQRQYNGYTGSGQADLPLDMPVYQYTGFSYGLIVYTKGPLFYVELERQLGRDTVYNALNTYFHQYEYQVVTSQDVEHTFEQVTGKNLTTLFHKWVGNFPDSDMSGALNTTF